MLHFPIGATRAYYQHGILLIFLFLCACDSGGPKNNCEERLPSVEQGEFAAQVRQAGECTLRKGEARFNPAVTPAFGETPAFFAKLSVSADEGPNIYFGQAGKGVDEKSYEVTDLSDTVRDALELFEEKVSVGAQRLNGYRTLSKSGTLTVKKSTEKVVVASFEITLLPTGNGEERDASEPIQIRGRFRATKDSDQPWVIM